nr:immunoglobulin heavy chain junction region [Macaca mulatta]MPN83874.1 immunoglobulin heavy chain junction region [Macaca mulatta]MPN83901.1 immunoglobulin heavy chain junction region [Macaca mulatta]MPN83963.1 immunoglobulin heavy chain junction region [Macaca mulatta]MPN83969.1 immunoglobulin heavy chain junction region [Macaca mulatta]
CTRDVATRFDYW